MKLILTAPLLLLAAACASPQPICDREAQEWTKFGTQEDECAAPPSRPTAIPATHDDDPRPPRTPEPPTDTPDPEPPTPDPEPQPPRDDDCDDDDREGKKKKRHRSHGRGDHHRR